MKLYCMSDIHGCLGELQLKMKYVDLSGDNLLILLGDYMDYGPESGQTLRYVYDLQKKYGDQKIICLKGNHEAMFLSWIDEYKTGKAQRRRGNGFTFNDWFRTDSDYGLPVFRTLVSEDQLKKFEKVASKASFEEINHLAAEMICETNEDIISWIRKLPKYYKTKTQIFVHAGVDEEAEDLWEYGSTEDIMLWKYPAETGNFCKTIIAGHVGTGSESLANDKDFHDVFYDGASHYYIDGSVYRPGGKLLLLEYNTDTGKYRSIDDEGKADPIKRFWKE